MNSILDLVALLLLGAGIAIGLAAKRRRFDRTNAFGIKRFPTFGAKLQSRSGDYLLIGGATALVAGGMLLPASNHLDTWGWIVMAPACLFLLYLLIGT